jgi:iron complex transport system substrate-binding protein
LAQDTFTDDLQRRVTIRVPAQRIVSLAPSITETLFAIGAGAQVVGVTDYCTYPAEARRKPRVGGIINPSIEAIIGLRPDLVIMSMEGNVRDDFRKLTSLGVSVYVTNPRTLQGIYASMTQLGSITGTADSAARVVARLRLREQAVRARAGKIPVRTLMVVSLQPLIVAGRNTFIQELLEAAGGVNLAAYAKGNYPVYSRETLLANNPDVILLTSDVLGDVSALPRMFPEWYIVSAIRHKRVYRVEADLVSRPGPRALDALESIVYILHSNP